MRLRSELLDACLTAYKSWLRKGALEIWIVGTVRLFKQNPQRHIATEYGEGRCAHFEVKSTCYTEAARREFFILKHF